MAAENDLRVKITAVDRASKVFDALQRRIGRLTTPADRAGKSLRGIGSHVTQLERFSRGKTIPTITRDFTRLSQQSFQAFVNVGRLSAEFRGLSALAPTAGFLGALGGAAALTKTWADHGMRLKNTAANMGMTPGQLVRYQRVGALAGVSSSTMTGSLQTLQQDAFKARFNGDPAALQVFRQLGIPLTDSQGNTASPDAMMSRLSAVLPGLNPMAQQFALQQLGLSGDLMPFLRRGPSWIRGQMAGLKAEGLNSAAYAGSGQLYEELAKFDTAAIELSNTLAKDFAPQADALVKAMTTSLNWLKGSDTKVHSWLNWIDPSGKGAGSSINPAEAAGRAIRNRVFGMVGLGPDGSGSIYHPAALPSGVRAQVMGTAKKMGLNPLWMAALAQAESGTGKISSAGAIGTMQLMPGTARMLGVNPFDQSQNVQGGERYFAQLLKKFHGRYDVASAAYNAGPGNPGVMLFARTGNMSGLPSETQRYVRTIQSIFQGDGAPRALPGAAATPSASGGKVTIDLNHNNAPDGVSSSISTTGAAEIGSVRITKAMPTAMP